MGNQASAVSAPRPSTTLDSYVEELGRDVTYDRSIGSSRFLKTIKAKHQNGPILVKVFIKHDPGLSLLVYRRRLKADREALIDVPNVYAYQTIIETERAAYLVRQFLASDLYDRVSTRPFLSDIEKKWYTFQLLLGMREMRRRKVSHGDLKPSNILVTTSNWLYITDLSPFKPVYIPEDDPADFSFFFDTSSRRSCYIAPERFFAAGTKAERKRAAATATGVTGRRDGEVTEAMDVFGAGCTIAEMWLEGKDVFSLGGMLGWRKGESSPEAAISEIDDPSIRDLVRSMLSLQPSDRPSFDMALTTHRATTFPEFFYTFFHQYNVSLNEIRSLTRTPPAPVSAEADGTASMGGRERYELLSDADERIERISGDMETIKVYLETDDGPGADAHRVVLVDGPALLVLTLITSILRNCHRPSSMMHALAAMVDLSPYLTDESKLDRLVPFVIALLEEDSPGVKAVAIRSLATILELTNTLTPSNAAIMTEYIFPNTLHLSRDEDISARVAYASAVASLSETGSRFLEMSESLRSQGHLGQFGDELESGSSFEETSYADRKLELQRTIETHVSALLSEQPAAVKRAILSDITTFCVLFGRVKTNEILLGHILTFLNDPDWMLRCAFCESIVGVAGFVGSTATESFILPLMVQALSDSEESIVARLLLSLRSLSELGLFGKPRLWMLLSRTISLVSHPNVWIRQGAVGFIAAAARHLNRSDIYCIVYPCLRKLSSSEMLEITDSTLLASLLPPIPRPVFDAALSWASKPGSSAFWRATPPRSQRSTAQLLVQDLENQELLSALTDPRSEEEEKQVALLRTLGLDRFKDIQLVGLREYLKNLAASGQQPLPQADTSSPLSDLTLSEISLTRIGITPRTAFISPRSTVQAPSRRVRRRESTRALSDDHSVTSQVVAARRNLPARLTTIPRTPSVASSSLLPLASPALSSSPLPLRPPSPSASLASHTTLNDPSHPGSKVRIGTQEAKSQPSVGAVKTTATGLLQIRGDDEGDARSGRSTPISRAGFNSPTPLLESPSSATVSANNVIGYDGSDPSVRALLESVFLDSFRDPLPGLGPRVGPISASRRRSAPRTSAPTRQVESHEPIVISHLSEHPSPIKTILVSPDSIFFVSISEDGLLRVWDSTRLERSISSKPRLEHQLVSRPTAACLVEGSHCFALASEDGSLTVFRVHVQLSGSAPKYRELEVLQFIQLDGEGDSITSMTHSTSDNASEIVCTTLRSSLLVLDLNSLQVRKRVSIPLHLGPPTCVHADAQRILAVVGTLGGWLTLWDLRFSLLLRAWRVGGGGGEPGGRPVRQIVRHPGRPSVHGSAGTWIIVALGPECGEEQGQEEILMETWDIETAVRVEVFERASSSDLPSTLGKQTSLLEQPSSTRGPAGNSIPPSQAIANLLSFPDRPMFQDSGRPPRLSHQPLCLLLGSLRSQFSRSHLSDGWTDAASSARDSLTTASATPSSGAVPGAVLFVGAEDRIIRSLDLAHFERSSILGSSSPSASSGSALGGDPIFSLKISPSPSSRPPSSMSSSPSLSSSSSAFHPITHYIEHPPLAPASSRSRPSQPQHQQLQAQLHHHPDGVSALALVDSPVSSSSFLISGDRAGQLRVWRL